MDHRAFFDLGLPTRRGNARHRDLFDHQLDVGSAAFKTHDSTSLRPTRAARISLGWKGRRCSWLLAHTTSLKRLRLFRVTLLTRDSPLKSEEPQFVSGGVVHSSCAYDGRLIQPRKTSLADAESAGRPISCPARTQGLGGARQHRGGGRVADHHGYPPRSMVRPGSVDLVSYEDSKSHIDRRTPPKARSRRHLGGDLTTIIVDEFYNDLRSAGRIDGKPLAVGTVRRRSRERRRRTIKLEDSSSTSRLAAPGPSTSSRSDPAAHWPRSHQEWSRGSWWRRHRCLLGQGIADEPAPGINRRWLPFVLHLPANADTCPAGSSFHRRTFYSEVGFGLLSQRRH